MGGEIADMIRARSLSSWRSAWCVRMCDCSEFIPFRRSRGVVQRNPMWPTFYQERPELKDCLQQGRQGQESRQCSAEQERCQGRRKIGTKQSAEKTFQLWCVNWCLELVILVMQRGKSDQHFSSAEQRAVLSLLRILSHGSNIGECLGRCLAAWASDAKQVSLAGGGVLGPPRVLIDGKGGCRQAASRLYDAST